MRPMNQGTRMMPEACKHKQGHKSPGDFVALLPDSCYLALNLPCYVDQDGFERSVVFLPLEWNYSVHHHVCFSGGFIKTPCQSSTSVAQESISSCFFQARLGNYILSSFFEAESLCIALDVLKLRDKPISVS